MFNRLPVKNNSNVVGYIEGVSGIQMSPHSLPVNLTVQNVENGIVHATGVGGVHYREYAMFSFVPIESANTFGWPTGTNCYPFGRN
ncbi:MAG: hypothetical protein SNJ71_00605 [Bacteroidales bacterium]